MNVQVTDTVGVVVGVSDGLLVCEFVIDPERVIVVDLLLVSVAVGDNVDVGVFVEDGVIVLLEVGVLDGVGESVCDVLCEPVLECE